MSIRYRVTDDRGAILREFDTRKDARHFARGVVATGSAVMVFELVGEVVRYSSKDTAAVHKT